MALRTVERAFSRGLLKQITKTASVRAGSSLSFDPYDPMVKIGKREVVGFGFNGEPNYVDRIDFPMPAVRFREPTNESIALQEKEKGDWKKLTLEEKKALYRHSYCQTFAEVTAPTGEWKVHMSAVFFVIGSAFWLFWGIRSFIVPPLPESLSLESQKEQLRVAVELYVDPVDGLASKYDYENNKWKD